MDEKIKKTLRLHWYLIPTVLAWAWPLNSLLQYITGKTSFCNPIGTIPVTILIITITQTEARLKELDKK